MLSVPRRTFQRFGSHRLSPPAWLYAVAVFIAAWLVFWIQPLAVRGVLPVLGGSPTVWNTAMVFFQTALLAGYATAHMLVRYVSPAGQLVVLGILWVGVAFTIPIGEIRVLGDVPWHMAPALWLLGTLAGALGLSFLAAASLAPLIQAWLAQAESGLASDDPYFLYAASNAGSVAALLAYPFLLEPFLGLDRQEYAWSALLLALAPLLVILWLAVPRCNPNTPSRSSTIQPSRNKLPLLRILALSAVPSALLLSLTRYLTTDVASVPLLWIVPLALYLGTFVHAFARNELIRMTTLARLLPPALIVLAVCYPFSRTILVFGFLHLLVFFLAGLYCHGALARLRPPANELTRYYLLISGGGLLGSLLVAFVAPLVFVDVYEYPIALVLVAVLIPAASFALRTLHVIIISIALSIVVGGTSLILTGFSGLDEDRWFLIGGAVTSIALFAPALLILRARPTLLASTLLAVFFIPTLISNSNKEDIARERTFFGVYRIYEADGKRLLEHGTTLHGAEWKKDDGMIESRTMYYAPDGPYSDILSALSRRKEPLVIGLAGLGTGSLVCYARPSDKVLVYEIDPIVERLARTYFAALSNCGTDASILIGDARMLLEREKAKLDFLALDVFSSGAIPVHLLTIEAFQTYLHVLASRGVIAVHISNRYLDLEPVLAAIADRLSLVARIKHYSVQHTDNGPSSGLSSASVVAVLARDENTIRTLGLDDGWVTLSASDRVRPWTDDYSSIVPLIRW